MFDPDVPLADWTRLTAKARAGLESLSLRVTGDLLRHFPRRHEDRNHAPEFPRSATEVPVSLDAVVVETRVHRFGRVKSLFEAVIEPSGAPPGSNPRVVARWFNLPWMRNALAAGDRMFAYGRVKAVKDRLIMEHPEIERIEEEGTNGPGLHAGRIVPVYPLASGITQKALRGMIHRALAELGDVGQPGGVPAGLQDEAALLAGADWLPPGEVLRQYHFPDSMEWLGKASRQLAIEEFFVIQLAVAARRRQVVAVPSTVRCGRGEMLARLAAALPYEMTSAQKRAVREIRADLKTGRPMHRLLQGDVGSGKTAVAMAAIALVVEAGCQAAVMAPTQILAEQHFRTFRKFLTPLGLVVAMRTAARKTNPGQDDTPDQRPDVLVGTHALLYPAARAAMQDVGLVVIDEQHKFGVAQRARLLEHSRHPHLLVMTATPIPRSLAMTIHGDLDLSVIDELPPGRGAILTRVRVAPKPEAVADFLQERLSAGRQAYIVYPLVEESEKQDARAAVSGFAEWQARLPGWRVGLITGRTPTEEKDAVMEEFRTGSIHVLVSTTVIEVGLDVPNASVLLVHDAGRFGLAQLHQLRGRVGRGSHLSHCILLLQENDAEAAGKLRVLETTSDGFVIAEEDLLFRGPGDALGTAQSGLPGLSAPGRALLGDVRLLAGARALAEKLLDQDPGLAEPSHQHLRHCLDRAENLPRSG